MSNITVDELYDYILKDADKRKQQVRDDVHNNLLSAKWLNTLLLGEHPEVFEYNPDTELEHIDSVLGKPQGLDDKAWVEDANYEQLPESIANKINDNNAKADRQDFTTNELPEDLQKNSDIRSSVDANRNMQSVIFDKILSNVRKNANITDEQNKLLALRLLYNNNTPGRHKILPDIIKFLLLSRLIIVSLYFLFFLRIVKKTTTPIVVRVIRIKIIVISPIILPIFNTLLP